jgi:NitT/TauT family transport system permease protein
MELLKKTSLMILSVFILFLVWLIGFAWVNNPLLLPSPKRVGMAFVALFRYAASLNAMGMSFLRLVIAMSGSLMLGSVLGIIAGFKPWFAVFFQPVAAVLRSVPVVSVIVILLIFFGFSVTPYVITFLMIFPLIYQAFHDGIISIDTELIDVYRLEDNRKWSGLWHCYLPLMRSRIRTVMLQSAGLGIKVLIMAEYLSQTRISIGNSLYLAKINLAYDTVFAWTILLILLALAIEIGINLFKNKDASMTMIKEKKKSPTD